MGLCIATWNVRGVMSSALSLHDLLEQTNCDVALISEHKLLPHSLGFMNSINGNYISHSCCDKTLDSYSMLRCGKGGVSIMYKKTLASRIELINTDSDRLIGIRLLGLTAKPFFIFSVYMPSNNCINDYRDQLNLIQATYTYYSEMGHVILGGDWNASLLDEEHINVSKSTDLRQFVRINNVYPVNTIATCSGPSYTYMPVKSMIDYIFMDEITLHLVSSCCILEEGSCSSTSDHMPIVCTLRPGNPGIPKPGICSKNKWIAWNKASPENLKNYENKLAHLLLSLQNWALRNASDIHLFEKEIVKCIHQAAKDALPFSSPNSHTKPYWNENIKQLHKIERHERIEWIQAGRPRERNHPNYVKYKNAKELFRIAQRTASEEYMNKSIHEIQTAAECDIRLFWKLVKRSKSSYNVSNIQLVQNEQVLSSQDEVLNAFEVFYKDICSVKQNSNYDENFRQMTESKFENLKATTSHHYEQITDSEITDDELNSIISSLKSMKAPGWDGVQNEHVIYGGIALKRVMLKLFNSILLLEAVPDSWKKGLIIPIYKGHRKNRSDINSYRPVTLLNTFYKMYERILQNRIHNFLRLNDIRFPNPQQQGFQKKLSCVSTVFSLQETIQYNIDQGSCTYVAFLDIKKAFDTVWHHAMLVKLYELGICGKAWRIICLFYENMLSAVSINRQQSNWFHVEQGVRQGGVLSTFLYLVYNDDLLTELEKSNKGCKIGSIDCCCPTYVDDGVLVANSLRNLQILVNIAYAHSCKYHYEFHADKSCVVIFGKNTRTIQQTISVYLGRKLIPQSSATVHLGIKQESNRSLSSRVRDACAKGTSSLFSMADIGVRPCGLNPKTSIDLYRKVVMPTVLYGCEVWNKLKTCDVYEINKFQRMAVKKIQGFHKYVRTDMCESMVGAISLSFEVERRKLLFLGTLCGLSHYSVPNRLLHFKLYMFLDHGIDSGFVSDIMAILSKYNLENHLHQYLHTLQFPGKFSWKRIVNSAIRQYESRQWLSRIDRDPDFTRFRRLHTSIAPASIYNMDAMIKDRRLTATVAKLWVMKPTLIRECHLCGSFRPDILSHLLADCQATRGQVFLFINYIAVRFGYDIAHELSSSPISDLLVKLLGLSFTTVIHQDDMVHLGVACFRFLKQLTHGLSLY